MIKKKNNIDKFSKDKNNKFNSNIIQFKKKSIKNDTPVIIKNDNSVNKNNEIIDLKNNEIIDLENNKDELLQNDIKKNNNIDNNIILKELLKKQIKNIPTERKLNYNDIKRISKFLSSSIFNENKCALWNGYVTNDKNQSKGTYINFYFNKKKIALHRLLYINYIEDITGNEYIKFVCNNKGKCCNIYHMKKYLYNNNKIKQNVLNKENNKNNILNENGNEHIHINLEKKKLIIEL